MGHVCAYMYFGGKGEKLSNGWKDMEDQNLSSDLVMQFIKLIYRMNLSEVKRPSELKRLTL